MILSLNAEMISFRYSSDKNAMDETKKNKILENYKRYKRDNYSENYLSSYKKNSPIYIDGLLWNWNVNIVKLR